MKKIVMWILLIFTVLLSNIHFFGSFEILEGNSPFYVLDEPENTYGE
ncbi:MAG: hypothetical protein AB7E61_02180 [Acholeplasmataceae bacterium]